MAVKTYLVTRTYAEWRALLTPELYQVMRHHSTERPGSCALLYEKRAGTFTCAGCDQPLFESKLKFESGTGWPSFNATIPSKAPSKTPSTAATAWCGRNAIVRAAAAISARLPRRPAAHRPALLHQRRSAELRAGRLVRSLSIRAAGTARGVVI